MQPVNFWNWSPCITLYFKSPLLVFQYCWLLSPIWIQLSSTLLNLKSLSTKIASKTFKPISLFCICFHASQFRPSLPPIVHFLLSHKMKTKVCVILNIEGTVRFYFYVTPVVERYKFCFPISFLLSRLVILE